MAWLHIISLFGPFQIDDYGLVRFLPLDVSDEESIDDILLQIDAALQYGEDQEPKEPKVWSVNIILINYNYYSLFVLMK